jgi:hypothetical protein
MKNIIKINQSILSTWEQANAHDRAVAVNWEGTKHVGVVTNNGAVLIVVPEKFSPFNFDALARRLPAFDMQAILDKLSTSQEEALGELSGMTEKTGGHTLVKIVGGDRSAWLDQKLVKCFGPSPVFKFYRGRKDTLTVFSPSGAFIGAICPVRRNET